MRFVYRDYPLPNHPQAQPAAEAALCAHDQKKFWDFHDRVFENQSSLSPDTYQKIAADLSLDVGAFRECVEGGKHRDTVAKDFEHGNRIGVNATPTFYINGRFLSGAQPFEAFRAIIDEELEE